MNQNNSANKSDQTKHDLESGLKENNSEKPAQKTDIHQLDNESKIAENTSEIEKKLNNAQNRIEDAILPFLKENDQQLKNIQWKEILKNISPDVSQKSLEQLHDKFFQMSPAESRHTLNLYRSFTGQIEKDIKSFNNQQQQTIQDLRDQFPQLLTPSIFGFNNQDEFEAVKNIKDPKIRQFLAEIKNISDIETAVFTPDKIKIEPLVKNPSPEEQPNNNHQYGPRESIRPKAFLPTGPRQTEKPPYGPRAEIIENSIKNLDIPPQYKDLIELQKKWGNNLIIENPYESSVYAELCNLNKLPDNVVKLLLANNVKIHLSNRPLSELMEDPNLNPNVGGKYRLASKEIFSSTALYNHWYDVTHNSILLHEVGHALDYNGLPIPAEVQLATHAQLFKQNKLSSYIAQEKAGDVTGAGELFADSFSYYLLMNKQTFSLYYSPEWYDVMDQAAKKDYGADINEKKEINLLQQAVKQTAFVIGEFMPEYLKNNTN